MDSGDNLLLSVKIHLKKDEIIDLTSRLIKDHDSLVVRGMTEIPYRYIKQLDMLMGDLQRLENNR